MNIAKKEIQCSKKCFLAGKKVMLRFITVSVSLWLLCVVIPKQQKSRKIELLSGKRNFLVQLVNRNINILKTVLFAAY